MKQITSACLILVITLGALAAENTGEADKDRAANLRQVELLHANVNGIKIAYKVIGEDKHPPVMLIMGLGASHLLWGDGLPYQLVDAGYRVVLFDNRDVGGSEDFSDYGEPVIWWQLLKNRFGFEVDAAYDLTDMAEDSVALLDELALDKAHIVGASMGGMIAQVVAARYPERIHTLTSIMSTPGFADHLPPPSAQANNQLTNLATGEAETDTMTRFRRMGLYPESMPRQIMAIFKSGDRSDEVKTISVPTLVLHGEDDTLIPPRHGEYTAELIEGSRFVAFKGMGHNMPAEVLPSIVGNMIGHMRQGQPDVMSGGE